MPASVCTCAAHWAHVEGRVTLVVDEPDPLCRAHRKNEPPVPTSQSGGLPRQGRRGDEQPSE